MSQRRRALILTPLAPGAGGGISQMMRYLKVSVESESHPWRFDFFVTHDKSLIRSVSSFPLRLWRFARECAGGDVALCHINVSTHGSTLRKSCYAAICRRYGVPYVLHLHGGGYPQYLAGSGRLMRRVIERLFLSAARVLVLGSIWSAFVRDEIGVPADRIAILPNAVPAPSQSLRVSRLEPPRIVFVGLMHENKGVGVLLDALSRPEIRSLAWQAKLVGGGDLDGYRSRIGKLGLDGRIEAPGWASPDEIRSVLVQASIFVLPSLVENLPLALLEAMSYGLCPVVTPVGAIPEVVCHGVSGLIVSAGDSRALADALRLLLVDRALMCRLGRASQQRYKERYEIGSYLTRLIHEYELATG